MSTGALAVVEAWQEAVNVADAVAVRSLSADRVEVAWPRDVGALPRDELASWMSRSGFSATPLRWFCGQDGTVVVDQVARWRDTTTGTGQGNAIVASVFRVEDGRIERVGRHDDLDGALDAAGLCVGDQSGQRQLSGRPGRPAPQQRQRMDHRLVDVLPDRGLDSAASGELDGHVGNPPGAIEAAAWCARSTTSTESQRIDAKLTEGLFTLPGLSEPLAVLNLRRGQALGLPSGQDVARAMRVPKVLSGAELSAPDPTPLWFYILKESELHDPDGDDAPGERLGPVGGRIVAEVLLGLIELDPQSFLHQQPAWTPTAAQSIGDLLQFATGATTAPVPAS